MSHTTACRATVGSRPEGAEGFGPSWRPESPQLTRETDCLDAGLSLLPPHVPVLRAQAVRIRHRPDRCGHRERDHCRHGTHVGALDFPVSLQML